jgi:hypothetical protein
MKKFSSQAQKMSGLKPIALLFSLILIFYFYAAAAEKKVSDNFSGSYPGNSYIGNDGGGKNNASPVTVTIDKAETPADAVLKGVGSISGHVTDTSGNSLTPVWVRVYDLNYSYVTFTITNSSGNYTASSIPAGNYKVNFDVSMNYIEEWYDDKPSFNKADPVTVKTGQNTPGIDAQLSKGATISGRVTDGTNGIAYVYVCLYDLNYYYVSYDYTDYNGYYQISQLLPGSYKVYFTDAGDFVSEWYNDRSDFDSADPVTLAPEETIELEDAVLTLGGAITGQVTNTSGNAVNYVWVTVYNLDYNYVNGASTTSSGYYTVSAVPAGNYKVEFDPSFNYIGEWYDDRHSFDTADQVEVSGGDTTSGIDAVLSHGGGISGRVTGPNGREGIAGAQVLAYDMDNISIGSTYTNSSGNYTLQDIPHGNCKVRFHPTGNYIGEYYHDKKNFDEANPIFIPDGQTIKGIDAVLEPGGFISGHVTDTASNPAAYLDVEVYDLDGNSLAQGNTDLDGNYEVPGIPGGTCKVLFDPWYLNTNESQNLTPEWYNNTGKFNEAEMIRVTVGQVVSGIDAVMDEGGSISGRITDGNENGIANIPVLVVENNTHDAIYFYTAVSGIDGTYEVKGLRTGNYLVIFQGEGGWAGEFYNDALFESAATLVPVTIGSETGDIDAVLAKAGTISGRVTDANGNGLENVKVRLYDSASNQYLAWLVNFGRTDRDGYYSIPNAIPGERKIMFDTGEVASSNFVSEYYSDKQGIDGADILTLLPEGTLTDINAVLSSGGGTLSGYVTNLNGIALAGVEVEIYNAQYRSYMAACDTNSNGYFEAGGLIPGQYKVFLSHSNIYPSQWYSDESTFADADEVTVSNNENTQIRVILGDGGASSTLEIIYPNGGEILTAGSNAEITWNGTGEGAVTLECSFNSGASWTTIARAVPNDGSYDWLVPNTPSENCLVRISENEGDESSSDTSDNVFTIVLPPPSTLTVTSPNGGERLTGGSTCNITWAGSAEVENVAIEYSLDSGNTWQPVVPAAVNNGNYNWTVPDTPANNCLVRIIAGDGDEGPSDVSDADFSIVSPSSAVIMVTSPNGGEQLVKGYIYNITWTCIGPPGIAHVKIEYSTNNGNTWSVLIGSTANNGSYPWTVIDIISNYGLIRVSGLEGNASDTSNSVFSIIPPPTLTLTSPNGGETWNVGSTQCITWNSTGSIQAVKIEYSIDYGAPWMIIDASAENSGSFDWLIPNTPSHYCWLRISEANSDRVITDTNDEVFSIVPAPGLTVTSPNGGERLKTGATYNITWTGEGVEGDVSIDLYRGESFDCVISKVPMESSRYEWDIPANFKLGDDYKVLIFKDTTEDYSDASFSITEQEPNHPDFNHDGKVDILWRNYDIGINEVWYMDGAKVLGSMMLPAQPGLEWRIVGTGDFNRDGKIDILWRRYTDGRNMVWYMNGTTLIGQEPLLTRSDINWQIAGTGDFNRDGSVDILWRNTASGANQVWYMKGVSKIGKGNLPPLEDQWWRIVGTGDFNRDGKVDILWRNYETGKNEVWTMDGILRIGTLELMPITKPAWQIVGTGDFNCDGATDILWRRYPEGKNMIWTMDGVTRTGYKYIVTRPGLNWRVVGNGDYYQHNDS